MRIIKISIEGLFGTFDHIIRLNQEERITIIHSPNGFGKTAILRLVNATLNKDLGEIAHIPFQSANIRFNDNSQLQMTKRNDDFRSDYIKDGINLIPNQLEKAIETISVPTRFISIERVRMEQTSWLAQKISNITKEYAELAQNLEATYPNRLVEKKDAFELNLLKEKLKSIEGKQSELVEIGLFDSQNSANTSFIEKVNDSNKIALSLYIEDMLQKLAVFDSLEEKVKILLEIINSRFIYKKMFVSKVKGIYFLDDNGVELHFNQLSSGEQHELVMFYELLFNVQENTLVLIDEPELSLHVSWQTQFLKDLIRVAKNAKFDVLLATHSPQIINDRWDLTVELKGKPIAQTNGNKAVAVLG